MSYFGTVIQIWKTFLNNPFRNSLTTKIRNLTQYFQIVETTQINYKMFNKSSLPYTIDKYVDGGK